MNPITATLARLLMVPNEISSNSKIKNRHIERHANSYIMEINANHSPTESEYNHISGILAGIERTDSLKETREKVGELIKVWEEVKDSLFSMRGRCFKVVNANTDSVYGVLRKGYTNVDRDNYIKKLVLFREITHGLRSLDDKGLLKGLSANHDLSLHHSCSVYGDLMALEGLLKGNPAKVPDLVYNEGSSQFG